MSRSTLICRGSARTVLVLLMSTAPGQGRVEEKSDMALPPVLVRGLRPSPKIEAERLRVDAYMTLMLLNFGGGRGMDTFITPGRVSQTLSQIAVTTRGLVFEPANIGAGKPVELGGLRALVLRDRIPAANPFDGSAPWREIPVGDVRMEVVSGGAAAWDGAAIGGTVHLRTSPRFGKLVLESGDARGRAPDGGPRHQRVVQTGELIASVGDRGTRQVEWNIAQPSIHGALQVSGGAHASTGFYVLGDAQRGEVDEPAWGRGRWVEAHWRQALKKVSALTTSLRAFENTTSQGTPGQHRHEEGTLASLAISGSQLGGLSWNGTVYVQHHKANATTSSIDGLRLAETPFRQLAVPSTAFGTSWTASWWHLKDARTTVGLDLRRVRGESREASEYSGSQFLRESIAGGTDDRLGISVLRQQPLGPFVRTTFGARLEGWRESSDGRHEISLVANSATTTDQPLHGHHGASLIPSGGLVWQIGKGWRLRLHGQVATRRPTLAERYQTWATEGILTRAAPGLRAEKNTRFEAAAEYGVSPGFTFSTVFFQNRLHDFIASRESPDIVSNPGIFVRERINLERAEVRGLQVSAGRSRWGRLSLHADLYLTETTIASSPAAPRLAGHELARFPRHMLRVSAGLKLSESISVHSSVRSTAGHYADEENTRRLAACMIADATVSIRLPHETVVRLRIENLGDVRTQTNRDPAGFIYLATPRRVSGEVRLHW